MKYPRTVRIFRGQLDAAPFAGVLFLMLIFVLLTALVYTPGVRIELPVAGLDGMSGTDKFKVEVAVTAQGLFYFENQVISEDDLRRRLTARVKGSREPLALIVRGDRAMNNETWMRLWTLSREAGITEHFLVPQLRLFDDDNNVP